MSAMDQQSKLSLKCIIVVHMTAILLARTGTIKIIIIIIIILTK